MLVLLHDRRSALSAARLVNAIRCCAGAGGMRRNGINSQDRKETPAQWEPLVKPMRLTLAYHPVTDVRFGATTQLQGTTLEISEAALRQYLLEDRRIS